MRRLRTQWAVLILASVLSPLAASMSTAIPEQDAWRNRLRYAHLVFVGQVISVNSDDYVNNSDEVFDAITKSDHHLVVTFAVERILRGSRYRGSQATVVIPTDLSDHYSKYEIGTRMVMSVWKRPSLDEDTFLSSGNAGKLVFDGDGFLHGLSKEKHTMAEINNIVASVSIDSVASRADLAILAQVADTGPLGKPETEYSGEREVTFKVVDVVKGLFENAELKLRIDTWGTRGLRARVPDVQRGETWYLLLRSTGNAYEFVDGVNSFIKLEGDRLIYDNAVELPTTNDELKARLRGVAK